MILNDIQQKVINSFLLTAKLNIESDHGLRIVHKDEYFDQIWFDSQNGNDASKKLLIDYIDFLKINEPNHENISLLESVIPKGGIHSWMTESEYIRTYGEVDVNQISSDHFGYYIINGIRIDADDMDHAFKAERDKFNSKKTTDN